MALRNWLENYPRSLAIAKYMVLMRPGIPGKSWNLKILNSRPGKTPKKIS